MENYLHKRNVIPSLLAMMVFVIGFSSAPVKANGNYESVRVKKEYKIKRTSDGKVSLYIPGSEKKEDVYTFTDFNADVLLLIYRRVSFDIMVKSLKKQYFLTKSDARRMIKMAINELDYWDLLVRSS